MRKGPHLVILGTILGSFLVGSLCYFISAGTTSLDNLFSTEKPAAPKVIAGQVKNKQTALSKPKKQKQKTNCEVSSSYPASILQWCQLITKYTNKYNLDANLVAAVMLQESGGDPKAYSSSGAVGLMQVMPHDGLAAGFLCSGGPCFANRPGIEELQDPEFNIDYGTRMLASLVDKYGDVQDALKAYGPANVDYYYADKVLAIYNNYT
jgi:soluble lytic murein transglycosylase-like protein